MSRSFLTGLNLNKNELLNARIQNLATAPLNPVAGQIYFDTDTAQITLWDGTAWVSLAAGGDVSSQIASAIDALTTDDIEEGSTNLYFTAERAQDAVGNAVGDGIKYDDASGAISAKFNAFAGAIGVDGSGNLKVITDDTTIWTGGSANQLMVRTGSDSPVASKTYINDRIGDVTVDGTEGNTITDRIATVAGDLSDHISDTSTHGVTGDIVGTTDMQTLTGKTIGDTLNFNTGGGVVGGISENAANFRVASTTYDLQLHAGNDVVITTNNGDIILNPDSGAYIGSATAGNDILTLNNLKGYIGDNTVDGSTGNTITDRIATAVSNLVDGAPELLDTLNELAAAINDDASFSSTITTSIGTKVSKSGDTMTGALVLSGAPTLDLHAATKKYVDDEISGAITATKYAANNTLLQPTSNVVSWTVTHNLDTRDVVVQVYELSGYTQVEVDVARTSTSAVTLSWVATANVAADTYRVVVAS